MDRKETRSGYDLNKQPKTKVTQKHIIKPTKEAEIKNPPLILTTKERWRIQHIYTKGKKVITVMYTHKKNV